MSDYAHLCSLIQAYVAADRKAGRHGPAVVAKAVDAMTEPSVSGILVVALH